MSEKQLRCSQCRKLLATMDISKGKVTCKCTRCGTMNTYNTEESLEGQQTG